MAHYDNSSWIILNKRGIKMNIGNKRTLFGVIIIIVGLGLLLQNLFSWFSFNYAWPLIIIIVGIHLMIGEKK